MLVNKAQRAISLLLSMVLLFTLTAMPVSVSADKLTDKKDELQDLKDEYKKLVQSIKDLGDDIEDQKTKVASLLLQVTNLEGQIENYETQIAQTNAVIEQQTERINELNAQVAAKEQRLEEIITQLKKRVKAITKTGNYTSLQLLSSTDNYEDFLLKSQVLRAVSQHDDQLQQEAQQQKADLIAVRQEVEAEKTKTEATKTELMTLKNGLETEMTTLESLYSKAAELQRDLEKKLGTYDARQKAIKAAEDKLEKEIEQLLKEQSSGKYGGTMYWPVPGIRRISQGYKEPNHKALDISGAGILKKPIVAAADGTVIRADTYQHYSYGYFVMVDHGYDSQGRRVVTLYAHMYQKPSVKVGDTVIGGTTVLGLVGNTGNSFGAHLHFEVRLNNKHVNPLNGYVVQPPN